MAKYKYYVSREKAENSAEYHLKAIASAEAKIAKLQESIRMHEAQIEICNGRMVEADARRENTRVRHENHLAKLNASLAKTQKALENC